MAFLPVSIPSSGIYEGYATGNTSRCVVIPISINSDFITFDDNPSISLPIFPGVVLEYDSPNNILNFQIKGIAGDNLLLWFDNTSNGSGPHYILTNGANLNANITNSTLNTNSNITNSSITVAGNVNANITNPTSNPANVNVTNSSLNTNANITNASLTVGGTVNVGNSTTNPANVNITNSTLNTNANITNSSLTVAGSVNANITNSSVPTNITNSTNNPVPANITNPTTNPVNTNITNSSINTNATIQNPTLTVGGTVEIGNSTTNPANVNITNSTLNTNANITNTSIAVTGSVNANVTNNVLNTNANITNNTINTNANITNSTLTTVVSGTVNENIAGQSVTVYQNENLFSGSFVFPTPSAINMSLAGSYAAIQVVLAPGDQIIINSFSIISAGASNLLASNFYSGSSFKLPTESEWGNAGQYVAVLPTTSNQQVKVGGWTVMMGNSSSSAIISSAANTTSSSFIVSAATWEGKMILSNTTGSNWTFYFGIMHSGNPGEQNTSVGYSLSLNYQGLTLSGSNITGISNAGSGGSRGGGGGGKPI